MDPYQQEPALGQGQPQTYQPSQPSQPVTTPLIEAHETDGFTAPVIPQPPVVSSWEVPTPTPEPAPTQPFFSAPPTPVAPTQNADAADPLRPLAVVRVLSPVGVEYVFMTFCLIAGAVGLASALIALVNGKFDFSVLAFPVAALVVSVPSFAVIFLHLKKLETLQPNLRFDPSKRRSTQFTQIWSFAVCLFTLIGALFSIFLHAGGQSSVSIGKTILDALCILVVAGGILAYYWYDEHKLQR